MPPEPIKSCGLNLDGTGHSPPHTMTWPCLNSDLIASLQAQLAAQRAVVKTAGAFVEQHLKGQPGTPGTLYPMTYGTQEQWHNDWDTRLDSLILAVHDLDAAAADVPTETDA